MRGQPLPIPVPTAGLVLSSPAHAVPAEALVGGVNMLVQPDGQLHVRGGLTRKGQPIHDQALGGISWTTAVGDSKIALGTRSKWYTWGGANWTDLTTTVPRLRNTSDQPARFVVFWSNGIFNVIGVNAGPYGTNASDRMHWWDGNAAHEILPVLDAQYWPTGMVNAADICILNNRIVIANITDGQNRFPQDVWWSKINQFQMGLITATPPSLATRLDVDQDNLTVTVGGRVQNGDVLAIAIDNVAAQITVAASVLDDIATDLADAINNTMALTQFGYSASATGVVVQIVTTQSSWPALARNTLPSEMGNIIAVVPTSRLNAVIYCERGAWFMGAAPGDDATAFAFERIPGVAVGPVSPAAVVVHGNAHFYLGRDGRIYYFDGIAAKEISQNIAASLLANLNQSEVRRAHGVFKPQLQQVVFYVPFRNDPVNDQGSVNPRHAVVLDLLRQVIQPFQVFTRGITCSVATVEHQGYSWDGTGAPAWVTANPTTPTIPPTWNDIAWSTWDAITSEEDLATYLGAEGQPDSYGGFPLVLLADQGMTDLGDGIPFEADLPIRQVGSDQQQTVDSYELFLLPASHSQESITVEIDGLLQPLDSNPVIVDQVQLPLSGPTFHRSLPKDLSGANKGQTRPVNWFQMKISGIAKGTPIQFAGGTVYVNPTKRTDVT